MIIFVLTVDPATLCTAKTPVVGGAIGPVKANEKYQYQTILMCRCAVTMAWPACFHGNKRY